MNTIEQEFNRLLELGATIWLEDGNLIIKGKKQGSAIIVGTTPPMPYPCKYSDFEIGCDVRGCQITPNK